MHVSSIRITVFLAGLIGGAGLVCGQGSSSEGIEKPHAYVRRVSFGATLSVLGFPLIANGSASNVTSSPPVDAVYSTTNLQHRISYGVQAQLAITRRFAVNAGLYMRRVGYKMNSDIYTGIDNPSTPEDERIHTVMNEDTRAKLYDLPVALRFYGKSRYSPGPRWFVEGGGVLRRVLNIKTSINTTIDGGDTNCCITTPTTPAARTIRGFVGGFGVQVIDEIGIRVVPEVRYTRWMAQTFSSFSTVSKRDQVEAMISLTF